MDICIALLEACVIIPVALILVGVAAWCAPPHERHAVAEWIKEGKE